MSWATVKLGDICTIEKGQTGIQKAIPGAYPLVVTSEERKSHNEFQFDDDAVIVPLVSGTGHGHASIKRIHYQAGKFALGSILCAVIPKDKTVLSPEYLFRFLELNKENELVARMKGMANVTLPMKEIAKIEIPLPPLKEQIAFVNSYKVLSEKNSLLLEQFSEQLNLIKQLRQSFLREAMQGKLLKPKHIEGQETGQQLLEKIKAKKAKLISEKKLKKERDLPQIKDSEIPLEIPKNWGLCKLGDFAEIVRGGSPRPAGDKRFYEGSIPFLKVGDLTGYESIYCTKHIHSIKEAGLQKTRFVQENTLMLTNSGATLGIPRICSFATTFNDGIAAFLNILFVDQVFLYYFLKSKSDWYLKEASRGQGQPNLNTEIISNTVLPLPSLREQVQIVDKIEQLMAFCDSLEKSIKNSQDYNEMLLRQVLREMLQPKKQEFLNIDSLFDDKNYDLHVAMIQTLIESQLGINHGEVANQKTIFHINTFTNEKIPYQFVNHHFGTFSQQLRDDLNKNPYLTKTSKNDKDVFVVKLSKQKEVLDSIYKPENKNFVNAVKEILDIYQLPSINKETDKIELLNTVSKVIQDHQSIDVEVVYQGMKDWKINQGDYKYKADKFNKPETAQMIKLIQNRGLESKLLIKR